MSDPKIIEEEQEESLSFETIEAHLKQKDAPKEITKELPESKANTDNAEIPPEPTKEQKPVIQSEQSSSDKDFKFDAEKYKKEGIVDEKALSELEKQERRVWEKDKIIGRQGNKMGSLKKELEEVVKERAKLESKKQLTDEEYNELHIENPAEARRKAKEADEDKNKLENIQKREMELRAKTFIEERIPDYEELVDSIIDLVKADNPDLSEMASKEFKRNPYLIDPGLAFNLAQRAKLSKENLGLKEENSRLLAELKAKPQKVIDKINQMTAGQHTIGTASGSSSRETIDDVPVSVLHMTTDQLKNYLRKQKA